MTRGQRAALFWVFLALFTAIGAMSLLVAVGVFPNADPAFRKVAIGTFIAGVIGDMLALFRTAFVRREPLTVTLEFQGKTPQEVDLHHEGSYEVWDSEKQTAFQARPLLIQQNEQGWWYCELPTQVGIHDRVRLILKERDGSTWEVPFFAFSSTTRMAIQR